MIMGEEVEFKKSNLQMKILIGLVVAILLFGVVYTICKVAYDKKEEEKTSSDGAQNVNEQNDTTNKNDEQDEEEDVYYDQYLVNPDDPKLNAQSEIVKRLHSWIYNTESCYRGLIWESNFEKLNNINNAIITKDNIDDPYKFTLIFRQLELDGLLKSKQDEEIVISIKQVEDAMKKVFGSTIDYNEFLPLDSYNNDYYKYFNISYDKVNKNFNFYSGATGCETSGSISSFQSAVEQNDSIILTVKVEEYEMEEESIYYTYSYTFKQSNGNYYLYSVQKIK